MSYIEIDMPAFHDYIMNMNQVVDNIVVANRSFTDTIRSLESQGWRDDVYRRCHNNLFDMQEVTNEFIDLLYELDTDLIEWYGRIFEEYADEDYVRPVINMDRVALIPDLVLKQDAHFLMSVEIVEDYIDSTRKYVQSIREEMERFDEYHRHFSQSFHTARYEAITQELRRPLNTMDEILEDMEVEAQYVEKKMDILWKLTGGDGHA